MSFFKINDETAADNHIVADQFNHLFVSMGPQLASYISSDVNPLSLCKQCCE